MLKEKLKGILQSYFIFVIIYLLLFFLSPYFFKNEFLVMNATTFIAVTISYVISIFITYIQNKDK